MTGTSIGAGTNHDYATIAYDAAGNQRWVARYDTRFNTGGSGSDIAQAIALDEAGNAYVTGGAGRPAFVTIKYDANGNEVWGAVYDEVGSGIP